MKTPVKALSSAAIAALLLTPVAPYVAEAATPKAAEAPTDGFYIIDADGAKLYYSIEEFFGEKTEEIADIINATDGAQVNIVQNGEVVNFDALFEGADFSEYEDGDIEHGDYVKSDGTSSELVGKETEEFKVIDISSITKTGVTVTGEFPSVEEGLTDKTVKVLDPNGQEVSVTPRDIEVGATEVTFEFEEALDEITAGTWTVDGIKYEVGEDGEFLVESVELEQDQVVDKNDTLTFKVNGSETTVESVEAKGYDVQFRATKAVFEDNSTTSETGKLANTEEEEFQYLVVIKKGSEEIARSERAKVTVEDQTNLIVDIKDIKATLDTGQDVTGEALTLGRTDKVTIDATTVSKNELESDNFTVTVDKPAILSVDGKTVTAKNKGTATITLKAGDYTETLEVTVGDKRTIDVASSTSDIAKKSLATGEETKATVVLKDQYGVAVTGANVEAIGEDVLENTATFVEDEDEAGTYTATLTAATELEEEVVKGNVKITVNEEEIFAPTELTVKAPGEVAYYELTAENAELDLKEGADSETNLVLKAYDEDDLLVETVAFDSTKYELKSSNEDVATVTQDGKVTALKEGSVEITVYEKVGALLDKVTTTNIDVVNTTPTLNDEITFTSTVIEGNMDDFDLSSVINATATGSKGDVKVTYVVEDNQIKIVEADEDGNMVNNVQLGQVLLNSSTVDIDLSQGKITLTGAEDAKGTLNIAVVDNDHLFLNDIDLDIDYREEEGE